MLQHKNKHTYSASSYTYINKFYSTFDSFLPIHVKNFRLCIFLHKLLYGNFKGVLFMLHSSCIDNLQNALSTKEYTQYSFIPYDL